VASDADLPAGDTPAPAGSQRAQRVRKADDAPGAGYPYRYATAAEFTAAQRAARWVVGVLNPFFQIRSLHAFNAKFDPEWLPRVLAYRPRRDLPRVGLRYAGAEGFLALPGIGELLVPRTVGGGGSPSAPPAERRPA
jgi:lysyl-tRNA synthetase, class II